MLKVLTCGSYRYLLLLPIAISFEILAKLLSPILPLFAKNGYGRINNNNGWDVGPRLPDWLSWFDTPDNSLYGDTGWQTIHCPKYWNSYLGMFLWLFRNSATGFSRTVLARTAYLPDITYQGLLDIAPEQPGTFGSLFITDGNIFQFKRVFKLGSKNIGINLGWQMNTMVSQNKPVDLCFYKFSFKIK